MIKGFNAKVTIKKQHVNQFMYNPLAFIYITAPLSYLKVTASASSVDFGHQFKVTVLPLDYKKSNIQSANLPHEIRFSDSSYSIPNGPCSVSSDDYIYVPISRTVVCPNECPIFDMTKLVSTQNDYICKTNVLAVLSKDRVPLDLSPYQDFFNNCRIYVSNDEPKDFSAAVEYYEDFFGNGIYGAVIIVSYDDLSDAELNLDLNIEAKISSMNVVLVVSLQEADVKEQIIKINLSDNNNK